MVREMTPRERLHLMHLFRGAITDADICTCYGFDRIEYDARTQNSLLITVWRGDRQAKHFMTVLSVALAKDPVEMRLDILDALNAALE